MVLKAPLEPQRSPWDLAQKFDAQIFVLNVFRDYPMYMTVLPSAPAPFGEAIQAYQANARKAALEVVRRTASMAEKKGVKTKPQTSESVGSNVQAITDYAPSERIDLIVIGTRGMGVFKRMLLGTSRVVLSLTLLAPFWL